jgi:hypothetical protein
MAVPICDINAEHQHISSVLNLQYVYHILADARKNSSDLPFKLNSFQGSLEEPGHIRKHPA